MRPLTYGSLFSGIGGFDLAFDRAGFSPAWQVEIDPTCQNILARHWPGVERHGDITTVDPASLGAVDAIVGGSPCQNLSMAGSRQGLAGPESRLFFEFVRIADSQPRAVVCWENVPGVFSVNGGRDFATVLGEFTGVTPEVPPGGWRNSGVAWGPKRVAAYGVPQRHQVRHILPS